MASRRLLAAGALLALLAVLATAGAAASPKLVVRSAEKVVDLSSQIAKVSTKLTFENTDRSQPARDLVLLADREDELSLSFLRASLGSLKELQVVADGSVNGRAAFRVALPEPIAPGKTLQVQVDEHYTGAVAPYPEHIGQKEKQLVKYRGSAHPFSPYEIARSTAVVVLNSKNVESYTKIKPSQLSDGSVTYGPFDQLPPFATEPFEVHYENNSPFLTVRSLERTIEISHWGNIAVEESVHIVHTGAVLKGSFSRYDYQRESVNGHPSVKAFKTMLPASASGTYYRDDIGNISTSSMRVLRDAVELELRPRFPLFGGWQTRYVIGYNVPSYEYLYYSGNDFVLKMRLLDHVFDDMVVEKLTLRIILPESARDAKLETPYPVTRLPDDLHFTYLDTTGRPVIQITKTNLVESHIQDFVLRYHNVQMLILAEPLILIVALYLMFLAVIVYVRLDFSINKDESGETKMRSAGQTDKFLGYQKKMNATLAAFEAAIKKFKTNKDQNAIGAALKTFNADVSSISSGVAELAAKLKQDSPELHEKLVEVQKLDKALRDLYITNLTNHRSSGKMSKNALGEIDAEFQKKKNDLTAKITAVCKSFE